MKSYIIPGLLMLVTQLLYTQEYEITLGVSRPFVKNLEQQHVDYYIYSDGKGTGSPKLFGGLHCKVGGKRLKFMLGVEIANINSNIRYSKRMYPPLPPPYPPYEYDYRLKFSSTEIQLPILVGYYIGLNCTIITGTSFKLFTLRKSTLYSESTLSGGAKYKNEFFDNYRTFPISLGLIYTIVNRFDVGIMYTIKKTEVFGNANYEKQFRHDIDELRFSLSYLIRK